MKKIHTYINFTHTKMLKIHSFFLGGENTLVQYFVGRFFYTGAGLVKTLYTVFIITWRGERDEIMQGGRENK